MYFILRFPKTNILFFFRTFILKLINGIIQNLDFLCRFFRSHMKTLEFRLKFQNRIGLLLFIVPQLSTLVI